MLMTYRMAEEFKVDPMILIALSGTFFILPYTFFCSTAGKLADKFDKAHIVRIIKLCEVGFMVAAALGFYFHLLGLLFVVLFCMGTHSAFFSPVKYALLPDHLRTDELMEGNAFMEGCTFIAILLGTIAGGVLLLRPHGEVIVSLALFIISVVGVMASKYIPPATTRDPLVRVRLNIFKETQDTLNYIFKRPSLLKVSVANSWFWFVCVAFMSLFALYTKKSIGANEDVATLFLTAFAVGIGFGAAACGALLKDQPSLRYVAASAVGMSLFIFDLYMASPHQFAQNNVALMTMAQFVYQSRSWHMAFDLFMIAFCGGFYIVPLYAVLQQLCEPSHRAQTMACNNVMNAFFMMASALLSLAMCQFDYSVADVFLVDGLLNAGVAIWLFRWTGFLKITA